jgi:CBS domain-containing protein
MALCAADIMSRHVVMIPREMSMQGAARMLARAGCTGAPVVDGNGRCIGVVSATDFMNWMKGDRKAEPAHDVCDCMCKPWQIPDAVKESTCSVEACMTKDPVLAVGHIKIGELAAMMMDAHIHRIIIVEAASLKPIGVVSSMDILAAVARAHQAHPDEMQTTSEAYEDTLR